MKEWQEEKRAFPDAFVCANDNIAAGICSEAARYGYSVPEDFLVTGCDNLDKAAFFSPQITTIESNRGRIGQTAMQILADLWEGRPVEKYHYLQSAMVRAVAVLIMDVWITENTLRSRLSIRWQWASRKRLL